MPSSKKHPSLNVYTASAGAGKTYTLTKEYLTLALVAPEEEFKHIIAMTFTNKATNEMKERIIEALYKLCFSDEEQALLRELCEGLSLSEEEIKRKSWQMLLAVLGDYSAFKVKTIDSFFQEVIRTFAYELKYAGNYKIEMDAELWLYQSILLLLHSLHASEYTDLRNWIADLSEESIDEGQGHDLTKTLMRLGRELFKEVPLRAINGGQLPSKETIGKARQALILFLSQCDQERLHIAHKAIAAMEKEGLEPTSFKGKGRSPLSVYTKIVLHPTEIPTLSDSFLKLDTSTDYSEYITDAIRKKDPLFASYVRVIEGELKGCNQALIRLHVQQRTASIILKHLSKMGTLSDINSAMYQMGQEQNTMLLGSSQHFIHSIIEGAPTPFIYERLGSILHHLMLDEFQDTARLQYENLRPLLEDTLSSGYGNLIVGDIKQSIYKFRNCDRSILGEDIKRDFSDFFKHNILEYNWRSCPEIVAFNNKLFELLPQKVAAFLRSKVERSQLIFERASFPHYAPSSHITQEIEKCYAEVQQLVPEKNQQKQGGIEIYFYAPGEESPTRNCNGKSIPEVLLSLIEEKGYAPQDIAILASKNEEIAEVAECLLAYVNRFSEKADKLRFISAKALFTINSSLVRLIVNILRSLSQPKDLHQYKLSEQHFCSLYTQYSDVVPSETFRSMMEQMEGQLPYLSLYDLVVHCIGALEPLRTPREEPYITHFMDLVYTFHCEQPSDLLGFLTWWDTKGYKSQLPAEEDALAITLLTIHQSKGLGFPIVLLPYPTWSLSGTRSAFSFIWTELPQEVQSLLGTELPLVALEKSAKQLTESFFAQNYFNELTDEIIDRLNLFYVAMTRAKKGLVLWLPENKDEKDDESDSLDILINQLLAQYPDLKTLLSPIPAQGEQINLVHKPVIQYPDRETKVCESNNLAIQLKAKKAFKESEAVQYGATMHNILSAIRTPNDIEKAVKSAIVAGKLSQEEAQKVQERLRKELAHSEIAQWFSEHNIVLNEQEILLPQKVDFYRPDRVILLPDGSLTVIDYKFGEEHAKYHKQVTHYISLLEKIGYNRVSGYLWYFSEEGSYWKVVSSSTD